MSTQHFNNNLRISVSKLQKNLSFMGLWACELGSSASADQGQVHNDIVESDAAKSSAFNSLKNAVHSAELVLWYCLTVHFDTVVCP